MRRRRIRTQTNLQKFCIKVEKYLIVPYFSKNRVFQRTVFLKVPYFHDETHEKSMNQIIFHLQNCFTKINFMKN